MAASFGKDGRGKCRVTNSDGKNGHRNSPRGMAWHEHLFHISGMPQDG